MNNMDMDAIMQFAINAAIKIGLPVDVIEYIAYHRERLYDQLEDAIGLVMALGSHPDVLIIGETIPWLMGLCVDMEANILIMDQNGGWSCDNVTSYRCDMNSPPDMNKRFNVAFACDILEHLKDPKQTAEYIRDHLEMNGLLMITVPYFEVEGSDENHVHFQITKNKVKEWFPDDKWNLLWCKVRSYYNRKDILTVFLQRKV